MDIFILLIGLTLIISRLSGKEIEKDHELRSIAKDVFVMIIMLLWIVLWTMYINKI
jgi:hypothetical protein